MASWSNNGRCVTVAPCGTTGFFLGRTWTTVPLPWAASANLWPTIRTLAWQPRTIPEAMLRMFLIRLCPVRCKSKVLKQINHSTIIIITPTLIALIPPGWFGVLVALKVVAGVLQTILSSHRNNKINKCMRMQISWALMKTSLHNSVKKWWIQTWWWAVVTLEEIWAQISTLMT